MSAHHDDVKFGTIFERILIELVSIERTVLILRKGATDRGLHFRACRKSTILPVLRDPMKLHVESLFA
jgi:hypothetical protein